MSTDPRPSEGHRHFRHKTFLDGAQLVRRPWRETRPGWDHDHCEFCRVIFTEAKLNDALHEGYCTLDEYHWICDRCVTNLDNDYHFAILHEAELPTVQDIRIRYEITNKLSPGRKLGRSLMAYDGSGRER